MNNTQTTTHTPGPWYTMQRGENRIHVEAELYDGAAKPATLAEVNNCIMEGEANAALIARAPQLLEQNAALLEALKMIKVVVDMAYSPDSTAMICLEYAEAAIALVEAQ